MWRRIVVTLVTLTFVQGLQSLTKSHENFFDAEVPSEAIVNAVNEIISNFFVRKTSVLDIFASTTKNNSDPDQITDIIGKVLMKIDSRVAVLIGKPSKKVLKVDRLREVTIFFVDSLKAFGVILKDLNPNDFNYRGYYLIVMMGPRLGPTGTQSINKRILEALWAKYIVNVNIIQSIEESPDICWMYTYFPYSSQYCEEVNPIRLNTYINGVGFTRPINHFPGKVSNLHNCPLSVATFIVPPFVMHNSNQEIDGFDGMLMHTIASRMNFKLKIVLLRSADWGQVGNGTPTGATGLVVNGMVNFTIGYFTLSSMRNTFMSPTYTYHSSNLVWVISPGSELTWFQRFYKPFGSGLWISIGLTSLISVIAISFIRLQSRVVRNFVFGLNVRSPTMNMINIFFGGAMKKLPGRNFSRFLLAMFMIYSLILRNVYTGSLFRYLQTNNTNPRAESYKEMDANNFTFHVLDAMKEFLDNFPVLAKKTYVLNHDMISSNHSLILESGKKLALFTSDDHVACWNKALYPNFFYTAKQKAATVNLVAYLHKTSCLTREFTRVMLELNAAGMIDRFQHMYMDKSFLKEKKGKQEPQVIRMIHLTGTLIFWVIGVLTAVTTFLLELIFGKIVQRLL